MQDHNKFSLLYIKSKIEKVPRDILKKQITQYFKYIALQIKKDLDNHVFVKHGYPRQQQSENLAKSLSPTFLLCHTPRDLWCQWSVSNPQMNLESNFGYFMTKQTLNIALYM